MFSLSPALWFVCARPKPGPRGSVFCFAGQNTCPARFLYCGLISPQPASMPHPIHFLYPHRFLFPALDQYQVRGLGFRFCRPKPPPVRDLAILGSHHLNHLMYPTPYIVITLPASYTNPPPISSTLRLVLAFGGENFLPPLILHSRPRTTSNTSKSPPYTSSILSPQLTPPSRQYQARCAWYWHLRVKACSHAGSRVLALAPPQPPQTPHLSCPRGDPRKFKAPPTVIECVTLNIRFGGQNRLPLSISRSLRRTTSTTSATSPPMSPGPPPQVVPSMRAHCANSAGRFGRSACSAYAGGCNRVHGHNGDRY